MSTAPLKGTFHIDNGLLNLIGKCLCSNYVNSKTWIRFALSLRQLGIHHTLLLMWQNVIVVKLSTNMNHRYFQLLVNFLLNFHCGTLETTLSIGSVNQPQFDGLMEQVFKIMRIYFKSIGTITLGYRVFSTYTSSIDYSPWYWCIILAMNLDQCLHLSSWVIHCINYLRDMQI